MAIALIIKYKYYIFYLFVFNYKQVVSSFLRLSRSTNRDMPFLVMRIVKSGSRHATVVSMQNNHTGMEASSLL